MNTQTPSRHRSTTFTVSAVTEASEVGVVARQRRWSIASALVRLLQPAVTSKRADLSYRYLARQIDTDLPVNGTGRTILVSSAIPLASSNEASLMFAYFLAAELGRRVLLVDGTFGEAGVGSALGHAGAPGLLDLVCNPNFPLAQLVQPTARENVFLLPAGRNSMTRALPIDASRIVAFHAEACEEYDYVVMQQGAIFDESRYLQFTQCVDMVLMLVDEGLTPVEVLNRCTAVFRDHQVSNVRLVVTVPP